MAEFILRNERLIIDQRHRFSLSRRPALGLKDRRADPRPLQNTSALFIKETTMHIPFLSGLMASPFDGLQEHAEKVKECAGAFQKAMECYISG